MILRLVKKLFAHSKINELKTEQNTFAQLETTSRKKQFAVTYKLNEVLKNFEQKKEPHLFSYVYWIYIFEYSSIKDWAASLLSKAMNDLAPKKLLSIARSFRTSYDWILDWSNIAVDCILTPSMSNDEKFAIVALSTFHPNGYFREKALDELLRFDYNKIFPFVIIRTNDWVDEIRYKANDILSRYIAKNSIQNVLNCYTLLFHTQQYSRYRADFDRIHHVIEELSTEELATFSSKCTDANGRYCCYSKLIKKASIKPYIIDVILNEPNAHIRSKTINHHIGDLSDKTLCAFRDKLLYDKSPKIRIDVLSELYKRNILCSFEDLKFALLDKYSSVRETARYYINKVDHIDFAKYYTQIFKQNPENDIALMGLCEVVTINDIPLLLNNLNHSKTGVIKKILSAISDVNFDAYKDVVSNALNSQKIGVSNQAKRILIRKKKLYNVNLVYDIYIRSERILVKRNAATVLCNCSKWTAIRYIIEFIACNDKEISYIGNVAYQNWQKNFNKSFAKPSEAQLNNIRAVMVKYNSIIGKEYIDPFT